MATKPQSKPISPVAPPESSLQQFMRLQSTFAPKPIAPPQFPITTGLPGDYFNPAEPEPLAPQRMEAEPWDFAAPQMKEKTRPFGYKPGYGQVTADPGLTPERQIPLPQQAGPDDLMQRFRDTVLNPPQRERMTYPDSTLGALDAALKVAATPTDYEKNRVYVDGNAYQQTKQFIDPVTGEKKYINKYKQPGFMEQVMKAVPAGLPAVTDILNQPQKDAEADWKLRVEGLTKGAAAESQAALAQQRTAQAAAIPRNLDIRQMDAETRQYLASLKDMPDSVLQEYLQQGRIDLATYNAVQAYSREQLRAGAAMDRTIVGGQMGIARAGMNNAAAMGRTQAQINAAAGRQQVAGQQALTQIGAREQAQGRLQQSAGQITSQHIAARGELAQRLQEQRARDAQALKAAPSGVNQSNSQQKIALQDRAMEVANGTPALAEHITFNDQGFPVIDPELDPEVAADLYESIYGEPSSALPQPNPPRGDINLPNPQQPQASRPVAPVGAPAPIAPQTPAIPPAAGGFSGGVGAVLMTKTERDGRITQRMVKPEHRAMAEAAGFRE